MGFRKVRVKGGPGHVFYAPEQTIQRWPERYQVVDKTVYAAAGEPEFTKPQEPARKRSQTPNGNRRRAAAPTDGVSTEKES